MTPMRINFAGNSWRRRLAVSGWISRGLMAAGALLCIVSGNALHDLARQENAEALAISRANAAIARKEEARPAPKKVTISDAQAAAVNADISQLNLPWTSLLDAIEDATPAGVALLNIEPDAKKHAVKIMAEAKSSDEMIGYVEQIKKQAFFSDAVLTRHEVNEQDPNRPLRFQVEARWGDRA